MKGKILILAVAGFLILTSLEIAGGLTNLALAQQTMGYTTVNYEIPSDITGFSDWTFDSQGKLWLAAEKRVDGDIKWAGLLEFGSGWKKYTFAVGDWIPEKRIYSLVIDSADNKWIGTWDGTIARFGQYPYFEYLTNQFDLPVGTPIILKIDPKGNLWFIIRDRDGLAKTIIRSNQEGTEKEEIDFPGDDIYCLAIDQANRKWFGTGGDGIYVLNTDDSWTHYKFDNGTDRSNSIHDIEFDTGGNAWIGTGDALIKIAPDGSQTARQGGIGWGVQDVAIEKGEKDFIWIRAAGRDGVLRGEVKGNDSLLQFTMENAGLVSNRVSKIEVDQEGRKWLLCEDEEPPYCPLGISVISKTTGVERDTEKPNLPESFYLSQNYPNPFNTETKIEFEIPTGTGKQSVSVRVFNILGQEIAILGDEIRGPGSYYTIWNGKDKYGNDCSTGVYFYHLQVGKKFVKMKKMTLLR